MGRARRRAHTCCGSAPSPPCKMTAGQVLVVSVCLMALLATTVDGRYLPTRGQEDRLDRLRDLLRDLLDSDREPPAAAAAASYTPPERRPFPKRDPFYGYDPSQQFTMDHFLHP